MRLDVTDIGMNNAAALAAAGIDAVRGGDTAFDLSAVRTCDSSAIAVVLAWQREAQARGGQLRLSGLPPGFLSLATVYGVAPLLNLDESGR
ncbi:MAG TPA: STAS domain-containing protein [Burkholderiaceae bacterium]|nr:STAS domain-containing protein [Burkholderiaceae bacterium]